MDGGNLIGNTLLNQYRVDAFVAAGGMGAVYRVWDLKRNVPLAMKVLHSDLAEDPSVFKRFKREANALKKLTHPNIVPFYGLYETLDFAFLLEHYVDGPSLKEVLRQRKGKPLGMEQALIYLKALCAALGYAHANGVVHCDVKPGNVMVDRGGRIYLTDFGIARHAESTTTTMGTAGTPAYMAPEQILGSLVTPATDIYSLGVLLFEMLTGQRPFRGTEDGTGKGGSTANERIRYGHLHLQPPDPRTLNSSISSDVAQVSLRALSKKPDERYPSASDFFRALCSAAGVKDAEVPSHAPLQMGINPTPESTHGNVVVGPPAGTRSGRTVRPWLLGLGGLTVLGFLGVVVGVAAILIFGGGSGGNPPTQPPVRTQTRPPTDAPLPTYTFFPTYTSFPTLRPSRTPRPRPTSTRRPSATARPVDPGLSCEGAPHPLRFEVGQSIYVCTREDRVRLRDNPGGGLRVWLDPGTTLTITGGPRCTENVYWWKVQTDANEVGWVMDGADADDEFFICAIP
jgi:serine/threonine protein kinase